MPKRLIAALVLTIASLAFLVDAPHPAAAQNPIVPDQYIVVLEDGLNAQEAVDDLERDHGLLAEDVYSVAIDGFTAYVPPAELDQLRLDPRVNSVEPDRVVQLEAQTLPTGIDRIDADLSPLAAIDGNDTPLDVDVAVIDTGIQPDHPDLRVAGGVSILGGQASPSFTDDNGHGTHVAGIIAARDNDFGVVGVAPGARLWAVKVLGVTGSGLLSDVVAGVDWVTAHATIDVVNMSLTCACSSPALNTAITNSVAAGVVYAVAAGNNALNAASFTPANHPDVLTVSAIADSDGKPGGLGLATPFGPDDTFATFSNFGSVVDIAAPGVNILSTYLGSTYRTISGTSMASPHVAGAAALRILSDGKPAGAASVAALRSALISSGAAQSGPFGFSGDPDAFHEPLVSIVPTPAPPPASTRDVAITNLQAPPSVSQGEQVSVTVGVANQGTVSETFSLTLTASGGSVTGSPQSLTLAPGASTTLTFTWNTATAPAGSHTLIASTPPLPGETDTFDNSRFTVITVEPPPHDVAVTAIAAPASVILGSTVDVQVTVANLGAFSETFSVSLAASGGTISGSPQSITLPPAMSVTVIFAWNTATASLGLHTLTALADLVPGEVNTANHSASTTVDVRASITVTRFEARDVIGAGQRYDIRADLRNDISPTVTITVRALVEEIGGSATETMERTITLQSGTSGSGSVKFDTIPNLPPGAYRVTLTVIEDPDIGPNNTGTFRIGQ